MHCIVHRSSLVVAAIVASLLANGQYWMRGWGSLADDRIEAMEPLPGGDVIAVGSFSGFFDMQDTVIVTQGVTDGFVARVDGSGSVVWVRAIGGAGVDRALDVTVDGNGNVAVVGQFAGTMVVGGTTLTSNAGSLDAFVALYNATGTLQWATAMGGPGNADRASAVALAPNGSVLVGGDFSHTALFGGSPLTSAFDNLLNAPGIDVFLARFSNTGSFQWVRQGSASLEEECISVACDNAGAAYFTGRYTGDITFQQLHANAQDDAIFLVKFDAAGNEVWYRRITGAITNQAADLEWDGSSLYMAGYQSGSAIVFGNTNTPIGSNYPNSAFLLKVDAAGAVQDQWTFGSESLVGAVDLCIGDTAIAIGGWFECTLSQGEDEHGAGLFFSIGPRNDWIAEIGLGSMQHGFVQQIGRHFPGGLNAVSLGDDEAIVAAGVYRAELIVAGIDSIMDPVPMLPMTGINEGTEICSDPYYGDFYSLDSIGLFDAFIVEAFPRGRSIYDVFRRDPGPCNLQTLPLGTVGPLIPPDVMVGDTAFACGGGVFAVGFPFPSLTEPSYGANAPWSQVVWSDGSTGAGNSVDTLEQLWATGSTVDGCYAFSDTVWGGYWPNPGSINITDDQGVNITCTDCEDIVVCLPTNPELTVGFLDSSIVSFEWVTPGGTIPGDTTITATASGFYYVFGYNAFNCANAVQVEVILQPVSSLDSLTALLEFDFPDDTDGNDTIRMCGSGTVNGTVDHTIFENGVQVTSDPPGITALDSVFTGTYVFQTTSMLPITINPGVVSATVTGEGWYTWEYHYYLSNFPCDSDLFLFVARDSIYVDTIQTNYTNVFISGTILMCAGDTVDLVAVTTDPGALAWTGPGIVGDTTAAMVQITQPGYYAIELTPTDTGACTYGSADTHLINLDPAPFITMLPANGLICPGDSIQVVVTGVGAYQWYGPTGPIGAGAPELYVSEPGGYYVVMIGPAGCGQASNVVDVVNYSTPYISAYPQPVLCNGGSVTLNVNAPGSLAVVQWLAPLFGNGLTQVVTQPGIYQCSITLCGIVTTASIEVIASSLSVGLVSAGPFEICNDSTTLLLATPGLVAYLWIPSLATGENVFVGPGLHSVVGFDQYGCTDTAGVAIVNAIAFTDSLQGSATTVCAGDISFVTATGSGVLHWYSDAGATQLIGSGNSIEVGPVFSNATVYVTQTEGDCTSDALSVPVPVLPLPPMLPIQGDTMLCIGDTLDLFIDPDDLLAQVWTTPNGVLTNAGPYAPSSVVADMGWYSVNYTDSSGCQSSIDSTFVTVFLLPEPGLPPNALICAGDLLTIGATPDLASYLWSTGAETASITVTEPGTYSVTVVGIGGCQATDSMVVGEGPCDLDVPNVITPNGDGTNDVIDLDLSGFATATFKIWNRWGQKLDEISAPRIIWDGRDRLTGEPVPSGTYFWTLSATRATGLVQEANGYVMVLYE